MIIHDSQQKIKQKVPMNTIGLSNDCNTYNSQRRTTSIAPSPVIVTAGFNAACCAVPDKSPTALVSISDKIGPQSHIPTHPNANLMIVLMEGASKPADDDVDSDLGVPLLKLLSSS